MQIADAPALWGFLGAVAYAVPRFTTDLADTPNKWGILLVKAAGWLIVGTIVSAAGATTAHRIWPDLEMPFVAAILGYLSNPLGPAVQKAAKDFLERWARGKSSI